jgi:hypothetical protein
VRSTPSSSRGSSEQTDTTRPFRKWKALGYAGPVTLSDLAAPHACVRTNHRQNRAGQVFLTGKAGNRNQAAPRNPVRMDSAVHHGRVSIRASKR